MQKFNGSLIRQFPSLVTGNAAAGVQVSVLIAGGNTLATLYATNNTAGAQLPNPLTTDSKGFYSFYAADGQYRLQFSNGYPALEIQLLDAVQFVSDTESGAGLLGQAASEAVQLINEANAQVQQSLDSLLTSGWFVVGDFSDGVTFTARNQVARDNSGEFWSYNGILPFTVTAGTVPSEPDYTNRGDAALRSALADPDSTVPVGGVGAALLGARINNLPTLKDFGAIGDGMADDTPALLAFLNLSSAPCLRLTKGEYLITQSVNITRQVAIVGDSWGHSNNSGNTRLIKAASVSGHLLRALSLGCSFKGFTMQGQAGNSGDGLQISEGRCTIEDLGVFGMGRDGVRVGNDANPSNCNLWFIKNLLSKRNGRHGLHISDKDRSIVLPDANGGTLIHGDFMYNGVDGIRLGNCGLNTFIGPVCQFNGQYGLRSTNQSKENTFLGGDFEVNGRPAGSSTTNFADFIIDSGSTDNKVFGGSYFNFPKSFICNEPKNVILGVFDPSSATANEFSGVQVGNTRSLNPRVLDWYEEGVFTPVVSSVTTGDLSIVYTAQVGRFQRVGNRVSVNCSLKFIPTFTTATGALIVNGLPYAPRSITNKFEVGTLFPIGATQAAGVTNVVPVIANTNQIEFRGYSPQGAIALITINGFFTSGNAVELYLDIAYECVE